MIKRKHRQNWWKILCGMLLLVLGMALLHTPMQVKAGAGDVANLVIFVKYQGDDRDVFNAVYDSGTLHYENWMKIKGMYQEGSGYAYNDSFQNYISVITEGKVNVINVFPQEITDSSKSYGRAVAAYTLQNASYDSDTGVIQEVLSAIGNGTIAVDFAQVKLDNLQTGIVDNLTIIIQGNQLPGGSPSHRAQYGGTETIGGMRVCNYNMMSSSVLVSDDASIGVQQAQGVIAHEFLHTLGLPDLYRYSGIGIPVGEWDVMAANSCFLQYPLSYLRAKQGWIDMEEITTSGTYTLTAVSEPGGHKVYAIKTPVSDSEWIILEFRHKETGYDGKFEHRIPSTGLLMYRVDTKVENATNTAGQNYIYVYRPGVTDPESAQDVGSDGRNLVYQAALGTGEEYGSTDLSADFTNNTLYYSDGSNSGVYISNVVISADETQVTFDVTFPDYTQSELWDVMGGTLSTEVSGDPVLTTDPDNGTVYAAYMTTGGQTVVNKWNGTAWEQAGNPVASASDPQIAVCAGQLYLCYYNRSSGCVTYARLDGGVWNVIAECAAANPMDIQLIPDGTNLFAAYQEDVSDSQKRLVIWNVLQNTVVSRDKTAGYFSKPSVAKIGSAFYVLYSDFFSGGNACVEVYDTSSKQWSTVHEYTMSGTNCHILKESNGKLYAVIGGYGSNPVVSIYDGAQWVDTAVTQLRYYLDIGMEIIQGEVYLTCINSENGKSLLLRKNGSGFEICYDNIGTRLSALKATSFGQTVYVVTKVENNSGIVVRQKTLTLPSYQLTVTPPAGYGDSQIYIDGEPYSASAAGGGYSINLPHSNARTAIMYCYNESNIPIGMYVWILHYQNGNYTAEPLAGLQDLLSYHGFSIRVSSPAGIRFKSGIDADVKSQLLGNGVEGYHLVEYGTLFMTNANRSKYPFRKLGRKTGSGRSYWTENGVTNDRVFETVAGRNRFASVLINLPPAQYATDFAFRGYVILEKDGERILLYGPPVYRSIYTVAKQVQAKGEFPVGSAGYNYVQSIIDSVEGR